jgi:hypothetical protein
VVLAVVACEASGTATIGELLGWLVGIETEGWPAQVGMAAVALSAFLLPANLLAVATADSAAAVNPRYTLGAVLRAPIPYLACAAFCAGCYWVAGRVGEGVALALGGGFIAAFVALVVRLYLLVVAARVLGTFHYAHEERLGWMH